MSTTLSFNPEKIKQSFPGLALPQTPEAVSPDPKKEVIILTNGDSRLSANQTCWQIQEKFEQMLQTVLKERFGLNQVRAHQFNDADRHGFIAGQRQGSDVFMGIDPDSPVIVLITVWQYSHHIAPSLVQHRGPILILANFDGTYPGLVGALNLAGSLTGLGRDYARLWSENFDDEFFYRGLEEWLKSGKVSHELSYLKALEPADRFTTEAGKLGDYLGAYILRHKEIMGLFDNFCMGMINGVFPQKALCDIGLPMEGLSQSMLVHEMSLVDRSLREECLQWYIDQGMQFEFADDDATELTREQVLEQCAMLIAMARITERFGLSLVGVQYQLGLKDVCPASDFAEGAIGSATRFPIPDENGNIIRPGKPIPCANEVDMGTAIPQVMLFRLLDTLGLPSETTLHDVRWGSEYKGTFYWDFEISGNVPFEHLKGGIRGATGKRQPAMYFAKGGSTISGQCKAGTFIWARAFYKGTDVYMHIGTGMAHELPPEEFQRRLDSTTPVWPLMNVTLDGVSRDDLMAGHESNHITVAYVSEERIAEVSQAFVNMAMAQNIRVILAGQPRV